MTKTKDKELKEILKSKSETHRIWHKFSNWLTKTYGEDLWGEEQILKIGEKDLKFKSFDEYALSQKLVGYDVMNRVSKYVKRYCPEIKEIYCDDAVHASSSIFLIPHPKMGITILYIPQCTNIQKSNIFI